MRKKCVHELTAIMGLEDLGLDLEDLDLDLDNYLLHPQPQHGLRIVHAFMHDRTIQHVVEERVEIDGGVLRQEQLIWCIKRQQQQQRALSRVHFKLRAMFLYNMDLAAEELLEFLRHPRAEFIVPLSAVEDVVVHPTIPMFAGMNALHIMYEGNNNSNNSNNNSNNSGNNSGNNSTKKRIVMYPPKSRKQTHKYNRTRRQSG
jgi:hypothetical protein